MMEFWSNYAIFLAEIFTVVIAILITVLGITAIVSKDKISGKEKLTIKKLNDKFDAMAKALKKASLSKKTFRQFYKEEKKQDKAKRKAGDSDRRKIYLLNFKGDIRASAVHQFRDEVTALLTIASPKDEIVVKIDSPGGMVPNYGLAAAQLQRIREQNIPLTACVDRVAASGGYLMASVADTILASNFALIGSIGVVAQFPNFNRLMKKHNIDYEMVTAGEYKRTLTMLGENTRKGREKFTEEVQAIHDIFKEHIQRYRSIVDLTKVATGEYWLATDALKLNLVDRLCTSDDYLLSASKNADIFEIHMEHRKPLMERLFSHGARIWDRITTIDRSDNIVM